MKQQELHPGDNWAEAIGKALDSSHAMVVLVSPTSTSSIHVQREIDYALQKKQYSHRLIPVLVEPTADMPWILERQEVVDLDRDREGGLERIASRLRSA